MARCLGCLSDGELLQWADGEYIEGEEDRGSSRGERCRPGEHGSQALSQGSPQSCRLGSSVDDVTDSVVPGNMVTIPPQGSAVQDKGMESCGGETLASSAGSTWR